jgi:hypothetical protein
VQRYLLRDIVPEDVRASPAIWRRMLAMRTVAAEKHDAIALSRALLCQPAGRTQEAAHNDNAGANAAPGFQLADFARAVQAAAERPEVTRFHADRAFIGSVWEHMRGHNPVGTMSLEEFKKKLVEAHRERLLHISRADLIGAMDPREVERSEARYQDATFHFVVLAAGGTR